MAKNITKRTLAILTVLVMALGVLAASFGITSNAAAAGYYNAASLASDSGSAEKPPVKKTGIYGSYAVIADYDNCLTETEEAELLEILHKSAQKAKCNVGLVITKDLEGKSDKQYAAAFSDENFGNNSSAIVLMLLNTYNVPQYSRYQDWLYASGKQYGKFTNRVTDKVFNRIYDKMGNGHGNKYAYNTSTNTYGGYDYYSACKEFARCVKRYGVSGFAALPGIITGYMTGNFMFFAGGIVIAFLITLGVVKTKVNSYKRKAPISASNYMDRSATRVTRSVDRFVREFTTVTHHSSSSGGHGGGGHSGGGGGGGRHR